MSHVRSQLASVFERQDAWPTKNIIGFHATGNLLAPLLYMLVKMPSTQGKRETRTDMLALVVCVMNQITTRSGLYVARVMEKETNEIRTTSIKS